MWREDGEGVMVMPEQDSFGSSVRPELPSVPPVVQGTEASGSRGFYSSEFVLSFIGAVIGFALCYHHEESMRQFGVMLIGSCVLGYGLSRGLAKHGTGR